MKAIITTAAYTFILVFMCFLTSCDNNQQGTMLNVSNSDQIEVYKYYIKQGEYIYVSRFKQCKPVTTTTWKEKHGKTTVIKANISIDLDSLK